jgi:hypothetical protein
MKTPDATPSHVYGRWEKGVAMQNLASVTETTPKEPDSARLFRPTRQDWRDQRMVLTG